MTSNEPLVSVLVTNYNYDQYLQEAIESVLNQTYRSIELIVVDDGSTDNSREIIAKYQDKLISVFKDNGGQASAINVAFRISRGEIIGLLDADDVWLPTKVEAVVKASLECPNASVIYHKVQNCDRDGKLWGPPWPPYKIIRGNIADRVAKTGSWWPWPPSTALSFTRKFLSQVMDIPENGDFRFSAEPYLADLAPFFGEVVGIDRPLSLFRIHDTNNWSNRNGKEQRDLKNHEFRIRVLNKALKNFGIYREVDLTDHLPYQLLRYQLGYERDLIYLTQLVLKNPWISLFPSRIKFVVGMWLSAFKVGKISF